MGYCLIFEIDKDSIHRHLEERKIVQDEDDARIKAVEKMEKLRGEIKEEESKNTVFDKLVAEKKDEIKIMGVSKKSKQ